MPTVMALFQTPHTAERAIAELSLNGFSEKDVSLVIFSTSTAAKPGRKGLLGWLSRGGFLGDTLDVSDGVSLMDGIGVGAVIGSLLGMIYGGQWRFGPIAASTAGLLLGGLIGYMMDVFIPEKRRDQYESAQIGGLLLVQVAVLVAARAEAAKRVLEGNQAKQIAVLPTGDAAS